MVHVTLWLERSTLEVVRSSGTLPVCVGIEQYHGSGIEIQRLLLAEFSLFTFIDCGTQLQSNIEAHVGMA